MNQQNKSITLLFNPFFYIAGAQALALGLAAIFLAGLVGSWGHTHFDGVLDTHVGASAPLWFFLAEGIIDWLCLAAVLWICGKIISKSAFRAVDLLGTQALARWPAFIISLIALPKAFQRFGAEMVEQLKQGKFQLDTGDALIFFGVVIAMIPFFCWMVALMYKSFSVSCNVTGGKAIGVFIAGLVVAEILSKVALGFVIDRLPIEAASPAAPAISASTSVAANENYARAASQLVDLFVKGDFTSAVAQFDETMKRVLPEPKLREAWQTLQAQAGQFQKRLTVKMIKQDGYDIALVTSQFERMTLDVRVVFDCKGRVTGLFFVPKQP